MIIGVGTDLVLVSRIQAVLGRQGERFAARILTPAELQRFLAHSQPARYLAKRYAAKEAILKALGTGLAKGMSWQHMRSEEHTSELQSRPHLVCRLLLEKKKTKNTKCEKVLDK